MNLQRKLEEIRRKPEHIKLRYTYGAVAVSMFFIIILWIFSISDSIKKADVVKQQNVFDDLQAQKKSLKDATTDVTKSLDDLNSNLQKTMPDTTKTAPNDNQALPNNNPPTPTNNTPMPSNIPPTIDRNQPLPNNINNKPLLPKQ